MNLRPLALLLVASSLGSGLFAENPNRDRDHDRNPRGNRHHALVPGDPEQDDATARRAFQREWYGEWTPAYRKFMLHAAAAERQRYADKMPPAFGQRLMGLAAGGTTWVNLGPTNADSETNGSTLFVRDSGRPVSIVVDPTNANIIYNATAEGGVWKTTNGGTNWTPVTETLGSLSCGCLVMDPGNSSTLYLGLGDSFNGTGIGLVKSTDGGTTWSAPVFLGASTMIRDVKVSSTNSQVVLAATDKGFFRSTDGGATWAKVSIATGAAVDPSCWSIAWGGGTNWAMGLQSDTTVTTGSGQIWSSSDDGATWTQSTGFSQATVGVNRATLASAPSLPSTMYAYAAGSKSWSSTDAGQDLADFYRSTDGGRTWSAFGVGGSSTQYTNPNSDSTYVRNVLGGQAWYNQMLIVDPSSPSTVYAGGNLALIKITNASTAPSYSVVSNWLAQFSLPYVHADFHAGTIDRNGTMYMGTDGGIFKQTSATSNTWTSDLNIGIVSHLIYSVGSSLNNRNAIIGGFQDNGTRVRSGSTSTFNQQIGGDGFGTHMNAANASTMLGSLYYARVYKSTDGGSTFADASTGIAESNNSSTAPFATRIVPSLADSTGNTVYTFSNLNVYRSTDYAGSWSALPAAPITTGAIREIGVAKSNGSVLGVVCSGGRVFLSANGGSSWTTPAALPNTGNYMSYIWFDTNNSSVVYVASVAPDSTKTHLWKSSNSGGSWTAIDGSGFPGGVPVNAIQNDPGDSNALYAGTNLGVYKSTDGGSTWTRFGTGLPLVDVTDFYLAPDSSLMRASTFGRGFWELTNTTPANTVAASITTPASNVTIASGTNQSFVGTGTDSSSTATLSYSWTFGDGG
ncbi:MAG TPA: hypothetical protein VFF76_07070, partial [Holophagaceae bacterium]|nr:hypothetical protein [Holophagaceae bacterium]